MSSPKILDSKGYRYLVAGKSYSREEHGLLSALAFETSARVEAVAACIAARENPNEAIAKGLNLQLGTVNTVMAALQKRDAANKAASAKAAAPRAASSCCPGCGRAWAGGGSSKICGVCLAEHRAKAAPRTAARHAPAPATASKVAATLERSAIVATSAQYKQRQAELARRR